MTMIIVATVILVHIGDEINDEEEEAHDDNDKNKDEDSDNDYGVMGIMIIMLVQ